MARLSWFIRRLRGLRRAEAIHDEIDEEMRFHIDMRAGENLRLGMPPDEARRAALKSFGNVGRVKEIAYDIRGGGVMETLLQDLRYGARMLLKNPGFTLIAVLTLALGIGANTAIFSVVYGVLLKALPYPEPDRLVAIHGSSNKTPRMAVAYPDYLDWRARQSTFTDLSARMPAGGVLTGSEPERVTGRLVSASFFRTLGVQPHVGRTFTEAEDRPGAERVMVLSYSLWQRRSGGDEGLIGNAIEYNGESWTVVGVMPAGFDFYGQSNLNNEFFIPLGQLANQEYMRDRKSHTVMVTGRLKPGVTIEQARAEIQSLALQLGEQYPTSNYGKSAVVRSFSDDYVGEVRPALLMISVAVALVLLIACANVTNLMLARAAGRRKEIALRVALGAGRGRVIRQLLTEAVLLSTAGAIIGILLAAWGNDLLVRYYPDGLPRLEEIGIDLPVLGFTTLITVMAVILFGLAPALRASKVNLHEVLKEGGRRSSGVMGGRLRNALVIAEVALSVMLLLGAGLLLKSFRQVMQVESGFDSRNVLTMRLRLPDAKYREASQSVAFLQDLMRRVTALPGVQNVSVATGFPLGRGSENGYWVEGEPEPQQHEQWASSVTQSVSEGYFETLGIALLSGRNFTALDTADSPPVVVVDEGFVRRHCPDGRLESALGKRLRFGGPGEPWREVVGVVRHVRHYGLEEEGRAGIYRPWLQINPKWFADFTRAMDLIVKTSVDPEGFIGPIRKEVQAIDKDQPLANVATLEEILSRSVAPRRFSLHLLELFALIALLLGAVGLYGVIAYSVSERTHEIGIRMALGARRVDMLRMVIGQGLKLAAVGIGIGLIGAIALTRSIKSLLFGVSATDPAIFAAVVILLLSVALAACYVPARRATKVDPMVALRYE